MTSVRSVFFDVCRESGLTTWFGNPGSTELRMLRDWPDDFRYVLALQEASAVGVAAGYAITTGRPALVSLHSAGGVGNALGTVFDAYRDRVPLVLIAGQQTRAMLPTQPFLSADEPASFPRPYATTTWCWSWARRCSPTTCTPRARSWFPARGSFRSTATRPARPAPRWA